MDLFWINGEGPKDIPSWVYMCLVNALKVKPENLAGLRSVYRMGLWLGKTVTFIRIYNPVDSEQTLQVKDFTSLDLHPELVLYEGYWENDNYRVFLERKSASSE